MLKTPIGRLRFVGTLEAISYLVLLGIAMPLKYMMDMPMAVTIVGGAHGGLFILYLVAAVHVKFVHNWSWSKVFYAFVASVLPFGPFVFDAKVAKEEGQPTSAKAST
ncbi:DUF3817 domain-containing protein [Risungbinella massiliensis]|uniref:DUF3817 domain-containing protein n=1 Tax=Risungbinella massiliensis TaxID=1329796 RepID=UPI0005CC8C15|nr:DUF3817 domain-containing protein [Risungbinella massiliensis]